MAQRDEFEGLAEAARQRSERNDDSGRPGFNPGGSGGDDPRDSFGGDNRKPIGVGEDYTAVASRRDRYRGRHPAYLIYAPTRPGAMNEPMTVDPRYFDGDEWKPASLRPDSVAALQRAMVNAGILGDFHYGVWDSATAEAYREVLTSANARGITAEAALSDLEQTGLLEVGGGGGGDGSGGGGRGGITGFDENGNPIFGEGEKFVPPPLELRTTNKADLRRVVRQSVIDLTGQGWTEEQINEVVDAYNWQEIKVQKDAYDQEVQRLEDEFMGEESDIEQITTVSPPSIETMIEDEARERDPGGVDATQVAEEYAPAFFEALGGYV